MKQFIQANRIECFVVFSLLTAFFLYWFAFDFMRWNQFDSPSFIGASRLLFGLEGSFDFQSRITKPLVLLLPGFMEWACNIQPQTTFILQNSILFFLTGWFMYQNLLLIFKEKHLALTGFLAFITCQSFAIYSLMVLSDIAGWFFIVIGINLSVRYLKIANKTRQGVIIALLMGLGVFAKESAVIGMIFFLSVVMIDTDSLRHKIKNMVTYGLVFLFFTGILLTAVHWQYGDNILARINEAHMVTENDSFQLSKLWQFYFVIDVYWFIFFIGVLLFLRNFKKAKYTPLSASLIALLISILFLPLWPYFIDRILFMIAPLLIIIATYALSLFSKPSRIVLIVSGGIINILTHWLRYKHHIPGLVETGILSYGFLIFVMALLPVNRRQFISFLFTDSNKLGQDS